MNLTGTLEDTPLRVLIDEREAQILPLNSASGPQLSEIGFSGYGPYTGIDIEFKSIGGPLTDTLDTERRERTLVNQGIPNDPLADTKAEMLIRLQSGGVTTIRSQGGTVTFTRISSKEVRGRFSAPAYRISGAGEEVKDDKVEGCFHIFGE